MVNTAEFDSSKGADVTLDLGVFTGDPAVEKAAEDFIASLKGSPHANNGFGHRFRLALSTLGMENDAPPALKESGYGNYDHSPSGAYDRQDQMTHGGNGSGGNWIED